MKVLNMMIEVVLAIILFEGPQLHEVVAIEISSDRITEAFTN